MESSPKRMKISWTLLQTTSHDTFAVNMDCFRDMYREKEQSNKVYYKCKYHNRFKCKAKVRHFRNEASGLVHIESNMYQHDHRAENETFKAGLPLEVKEILSFIVEGNPSITPTAAYIKLVNRPFNFKDLDVSKVRTHMRTLKKKRSGNNIEFDIAGVWDIVEKNQYNPESSVHDMFFLQSADSVFFENLTGSRMELYLSTPELLRSIQKLNGTASSFQIVLDSKHRMLHNNYPISVLGVLDAGQQFHLISIAISNKEDEFMYRKFISVSLSNMNQLYGTLEVQCTQSDQADAIMNAFKNEFPTAALGSCLFHVQQNNKRKRLLWNISSPSSLSKTEKSKYVRKKRDELTCYSRDMIAWLSLLTEQTIFDICTELYITCLKSENHIEHAMMMENYSKDGQKGWCRAYMPIGSATTNNALESFNRHAMQSTLSGGSRSTIGELIDHTQEFIRGASMLENAKDFPLNPLDIRRSVHVSSARLLRVKQMFKSAATLKKELEESGVPFYTCDDLGGYYICSGKHRSLKSDINSLVRGHNYAKANCLHWQKIARTVIDKWELDKNTQSNPSVRDTLRVLKEKVDVQYSSFWKVQKVPVHENLQRKYAQDAAILISQNDRLPLEDRDRAQNCIETEDFLWFGVLTHRCSCPLYLQYGACKHCIWATQLTSSINIHPRGNSSGLAVRRRAGRPRSTGNSYTFATQNHMPLI